MFHSTFDNRIMNYELKSVLFVKLGFNIYLRPFIHNFIN